MSYCLLALCSFLILYTMLVILRTTWFFVRVHVIFNYFLTHRSFAKKLKADLAKNNEETTGSKSTGPVAATLLDMNFSDEEDDKSRSPKSENANAPVEVETEVVSSASHVGCQRDEDYHPTADDLSLLRRDILYDMQDVEAKSESSRDEFEADFDDEDDSDSQNASFCTIEPFDTPHREYYLRSRKRDEGCLAGLTPNILHMLDEDDPDADAAERDAQRFADSFVAANTSTENDPEEQIYANFLQSLYSNSPRSETNVSTPHVDVVRLEVIAVLLPLAVLEPSNFEIHSLKGESQE